MRLQILIRPRERKAEVKGRATDDPERQKLEGLTEAAILGTGFINRITQGQALSVVDVRRYNELCYRFLGHQQDGGEFVKADPIEVRNGR